jgi:hypothetical protein
MAPGSARAASFSHGAKQPPFERRIRPGEIMARMKPREEGKKGRRRRRSAQGHGKKGVYVQLVARTRVATHGGSIFEDHI